MSNNNNLSKESSADNYALPYPVYQPPPPYGTPESVAPHGGVAASAPLSSELPISQPITAMPSPKPGMPQPPPGMPYAGMPQPHPGMPYSGMPQPPPGMPYAGMPQPPYGNGQPVTAQPMQGIPTVYGNGGQIPVTTHMDPLGYLASVDQLLVHQQIELLEVMTGFETENKYRVRNSLGQEVFYAKESSDCCTRNCCGALRPFDMKIYDNFKNEVIHLYRPLACMGCCFPCCLQTMEVSAPPGNVIGKIKQKWSIFYPSFVVENANGDVMYRIKGPFWTCSCCCNDVVFRVTTADGKEDIGKITKQWSGLVREAVTDADNFGITFPMDMDVHMKATMLGACFLIDFMFFEQTGNNNRHHHNY